MSKVQQLCQTIAEHPSKINSLNEILKQALINPNYDDMEAILKLIEGMPSSVASQSFVSNKLKAIFVVLINRVSQGDEEMIKLLQDSYQLSNSKEDLSRQFVDFASQNEIDWMLGWPGNILSGVFERIAMIIQTSVDADWKGVINMLLTLPAFAQLDINPDIEQNFKKNFQRLLLSVLASQKCPAQLLKQLYHGLGMKILSKMAQPLALSNHCLNRFAKNPQIQIQILSCLFLLVGKFGLELQEFYPKLQNLIKYRNKSRSIYELPNSRRFFKLLQASLRSSRVPFKIISNFAHILIRQIPGQNGQFTFWTLSFIVNLTKKHRKLLDEIPLLPEIKALKHHHNVKVRNLVGQLFKNLNKIDYLQIENFTSINLQTYTQQKIQQAMNSLLNEDLEFKIPPYEEPF